jgi:lipopolysaccharide/colanic/teichoic acid biosynthesis glycosyltransferase
VAARAVPPAWKTQIAATGLLPAPRNAFARRTLDLALSLVALLFTLPLYPIIVLAIRLDSKGHALYRQTRVGRNGQTFTVLKFRSMYVSQQPVDPVYRDMANKWMAGVPLTPTATDADAPHDTASEVSATNAQTASNTTTPVPSPAPSSRAKAAPKYKLANDPRITHVGRFLRATSLDELPQFINVLLGDMSIVGPRPAIPFEVDRYAPRDFGRLLVKPGITGLWQVEGRGHVTFQQMIDLDLKYVARNSLWYDVGLILRTVPAVLRRSGAA